MTITAKHIALAHISINSNDRLTAAEKADALRGLSLLESAAHNSSVTVRTTSPVSWAVATGRKMWSSLSRKMSCSLQREAPSTDNP